MIGFMTTETRPFIPMITFLITVPDTENRDFSARCHSLLAGLRLRDEYAIAFASRELVERTALPMRAAKV